MTVKVLIKRIVPKSKAEQMMPLFRQMRSLAVTKKGYISGETLHNMNDPEKFLVISNWQTPDAWREWLISDDRKEIQDKIDALLGESTDYEVYHYDFVQ